jgi:hypothetical protein
MYWLHDALVGYFVLTPFLILSTIGAVSDAHMFLLYNPRFVEVLNLNKFHQRLQPELGPTKKEIDDIKLWADRIQPILERLDPSARVDQ